DRRCQREHGAHRRGKGIARRRLAPFAVFPRWSWDFASQLELPTHPSLSPMGAPVTLLTGRLLGSVGSASSGGYGCGASCAVRTTCQQRGSSTGACGTRTTATWTRAMTALDSHEAPRVSPELARARTRQKLGTEVGSKDGLRQPLHSER